MLYVFFIKSESSYSVYTIFPYAGEHKIKSKAIKVLILYQSYSPPHIWNYKGSHRETIGELHTKIKIDDNIYDADFPGVSKLPTEVVFNFEQWKVPRWPFPGFTTNKLRINGFLYPSKIYWDDSELFDL